MRRPPKLDDRAAGAAAVPSNAARAAGWNVFNASRIEASRAASTALGRARATLVTSSSTARASESSAASVL